MRLAALGLALLLSFGAAAAHAEQREYGVKAGPTVATIVDDVSDGYGYRRKVSLGGGGFVVLPLGGPLAVQIEALFTPKGGKLSEQSNVTSSLLLNYFEFPLLARITPVRSSSASFHVFGGPSAGFRVSAKYKLAQSQSGLSSGYTEDVSESVKRFDWGLIAGGGVNAGRHLVIDARYFWGLMDVNRDVELGGGVRNRALTVLAGFRF